MQTVVAHWPLRQTLLIAILQLCPLLCLLKATIPDVLHSGVGVGVGSSALRQLTSEDCEINGFRKVRIKPLQTTRCAI